MNPSAAKALELSIAYHGPKTDLNQLFKTSDRFRQYIEDRNQIAIDGHSLRDQLKQIEKTPHLFLEQLKIQHPVRGAVELQPYPFQTKLFDHVLQNRFSVTNIARQMGGSTVMAGLVLHQSLFVKNHITVVVSPNFTASRDFLDRIKFMYENMDEELRDLIDVKTYNKNEVEWKNGSRIITRAANSDACRGLSSDLVLLQDAAYLSHKDSTAVFASFMPTVHGKQGKIALVSCGGETRGIFYDIWTGAINQTNSFVPMQVNWWEHPDRDEEWAKPYRDYLGSKQFSKEFECQFVDVDKK